METLTILIICNAIIVIALQAFFPKKRHFIMVTGATIALLASTFNGKSLNNFLGLLPWDTVIILLALTLFGEFIFGSRLFGYLIKYLSKYCKGKPWRILLIFSILTFVVSSFLNNYQALILILPALLGIISLSNELSKPFLIILFSCILIISNIAGASTPIGDFPALYLLSKGIITFSSYFVNATPFALLAAIIVIGVSLFVYSKQPIKTNSETEKLSVAYTINLYRNVKINWYYLLPSIFIFVGMFVFWLMGYNPTKVAVVGFVLLALTVNIGAFAEEKIKTIDSSIFIYYLSLFVIIASIQETGVLTMAAEYLKTFSSSLITLILVFSVTTVIVTGLVSAGPATVALFPVAMEITKLYPDNMVITCFCLSICAGSSLFLTSATAGPLLTNISEKYTVKVNNEPFVFSFKHYLLPGFIGALIIFCANLLYIAIKL